MKRALLCETVTGRTMAEIVAARDAVDAADMVEVRLDYVDRPDAAGALAGRRRPVVVTCRPTWEGGRFDGSEEERKRVLRQALDSGADYVDVEWRAGFGDLVQRHPSRVVLSSHDFGAVPSDLPGRARAMRQSAAGVIKVAIATARLSDSLALLDIGREGHAVVIGMGDAGLPTRVLATHFGSLWSYAHAGRSLAPGQMAPRQMVDEFRFQDINPQTAIYGVVGSNVLHSLSPVMHNAAFADAGINAVYVPFRPSNFEDFLNFADALDVSGASVTIPFKLDALRASTPVDALTRRVGAANTLRRRQTEWESTNTDADGFLEPLERVYGPSLKDARVAVLGAGGASRGVVAALLSRGARPTVYARRIEQARELADVLGAAPASWPPPAASWDVLVNCTPIGGASAPDESPLPGGPFDGALVYDLTYGAQESVLLREARAAGCLTLDGLPMLVAQAERQFEWWTGHRPAPGVMRAAAERRLETTQSQPLTAQERA